MPIRAAEFGSDPLVVFFTLFKVRDHEKTEGRKKKTSSIPPVFRGAINRLQTALKANEGKRCKMETRANAPSRALTIRMLAR